MWTAWACARSEERAINWGVLRFLPLGLSLLGASCVVRSALRAAPSPSAVETVRAVPYHDGPEVDQQKHRLDLYLPGGEGPHPVVVFVHGGGWIFGDRNVALDTYGKLGRRLATRGVLAAVISYRLAPGHRHPAQVTDVARAVRWTLEHAAEHRGDPGRVFLMGHSAGAQLVALLATDPRYLAEQGRTPSELAGVIAISGPYDVDRLGRSLLIGGANVHAAFGPDPATWRDASPGNHLGDGEPPPFLLAFAEGDYPILRHEAVRFARKLWRVGIPVGLREAEGKDHFTVIMDLGAEGDPLGEWVQQFLRDPKGGSGGGEVLELGLGAEPVAVP